MSGKGEELAIGYCGFAGGLMHVCIPVQNTWVAGNSGAEWFKSGYLYRYIEISKLTTLPD